MVDGIEKVGCLNRDIPPYSLRRMVGAPPLDFTGRMYRLQGPRWLGHLRTIGELDAASSILEIGCGCGRVSGEILAHKKMATRFVGFDVREDLIDWAKEHLQRKFGNAEFFHAAIHNARYNDGGTIDASGYAFPFGSDEFELIYATSVFTHLLDVAVANYFKEIARILKPDGKFVATFFLVDIDHPHQTGGARRGPDGARPWRGPGFYNRVGSAYSPYSELPERMIGYRIADIAELATKAGLKIAGVHPGFWKHGGPSITWQDLLVFERF